MTETIKINRAPVLTLWASVVAERLGFDRATALTLGQAVAGLSAYAKGVSLGIIEPNPDLVRDHGDRLVEGEQVRVDLLGRAVPVVRTPEGLRAVSKGKPGKPDRIEKYLAAKFGDRLGDARLAMVELPRPTSPPISGARFPPLRGVQAGRARGRERVGSQGRAGSPARYGGEPLLIRRSRPMAVGGERRLGGSESQRPAETNGFNQEVK